MADERGGRTGERVKYFRQYLNLQANRIMFAADQRGRPERETWTFLYGLSESEKRVERQADS